MASFAFPDEREPWPLRCRGDDPGSPCAGRRILGRDFARRFTNYNDTYGHQAGDDVLRTVAATLSSLARDSDQVYRYGGEEFLLVLPEHEQKGAVPALHRVRRAVEDLGFVHAEDGPGGVITVSIDIAGFRPQREVTSSILLAEADQAPYEDNAAGCNTVVCGQGQ